MVSFSTALLDVTLPDGTELPGRRFEDEGGVYYLPVGDEAKWPDRVVGVEGLTIRVVGKPHERIPVTARWANDDDAVPNIPMPSGAVVVLEVI